MEVCTITKNEIDYQQLLESRRHNVATEAQAKEELAERQRSNLANEALTASRDSATAAHYLRSDELGANRLTEDIRHNMRTEDDAIAMHQDNLNNRLQTAQIMSNNPLGQALATGYLANNGSGGFISRSVSNAPGVSSGNSGNGQTTKTATKVTYPSKSEAISSSSYKPVVTTVKDTGGSYNKLDFGAIGSNIKTAVSNIGSLGTTILRTLSGKYN